MSRMPDTSLQQHQPGNTGCRVRKSRQNMQAKGYVRIEAMVDPETNQLLRKYCGDNKCTFGAAIARAVKLLTTMQNEPASEQPFTTATSKAAAMPEKKYKWRSV
ncbi:MAG TPA: hypothetical protein PLW81_00260 [Thiobacillaceae bacterium]|nr:hypothetical protein [Thiobacillaceae bacterium]